jgi:hypothetical protein
MIIGGGEMNLKVVKIVIKNQNLLIERLDDLFILSDKKLF